MGALSCGLKLINCNLLSCRKAENCTPPPPTWHHPGGSGKETEVRVGENNSWDCSRVGSGLLETDSVKTMKSSECGSRGMAGGGCSSGRKMNIRYSRIEARRILQIQGARVIRRVLPREFPG